MAERRYIITEKLVELIEGQLTNEYCRLCPHEGGGINSGIKAYIRSAPYDPDALKAEALIDLKEAFFHYVHPDSDAGKVMKTLIKHRITEQP